MRDIPVRVSEVQGSSSYSVFPASRRSRRGSFASSLALVTVAFLLLNLPYWWLGRTQFLSRAWFNVDLLIPALIAPFSLPIAVLALLVFWTMDLAVSEALAWNFHSPVDFIRSVEFLPMLNVTTYVSFASACGMLGFVACGAGGLWTARRARSVGSSVGVLLVTVALVDILNGSSFFWTAAQRLLPGNVGGSASKMVVTSLLSQRGEKIRLLPERQALTSQFDVLAYARQHPDRGILLLVVESMGRHEDSRMRQLLLDHLVSARLAERYQLLEYSVPFHGSTVSGELRELCGVEGTYRSLFEAHPNCLPHKLEAMGWTTIGLHGFSRRMFMRKDWWSETGLEDGLFGEDLAVPGRALCGGAFVGICDSDLVRRAVEKAETPRSFVYALTLNSHLPLEAKTPDPETQRACTAANVGNDVCALITVLDTALSALRDALVLADRPPLVLIVGDHAPPFSTSASRQQFSQVAVPGLALVPRQ